MYEGFQGKTVTPDTLVSINTAEVSRPIRCEGYICHDVLYHTLSSWCDTPVFGTGKFKCKYSGNVACNVPPHSIFFCCYTAVTPLLVFRVVGCFTLVSPGRSFPFHCLYIDRWIR